MSASIGKPVNRVTGIDKVTGTASFSTDIDLPQLAYGVLLSSEIAKGRISSIDTETAEAIPGVLAIITHLDAPKLNEVPKDLKPVQGKAGQKLIPLQSEKIYYWGQHIGIVVAETLELATYAASSIDVDYEKEEPVVNLSEQLEKAYSPNDLLGLGTDTTRGDVEKGLTNADVRVEFNYTTPIEHHNPMEPSATVATWSGEQLTLYEATQGINSTANIVSAILGISRANVRVISHFVGGGFGCKGFTWFHTILAAIASKKVKRPVKLVLTRQQMFTSVGYRAKTLQNICLGATSNGKLTAIRHHSTNLTATYEDFAEPCGGITPMLYSCPNVEVTHRVVKANLGTPTIMRAPGEATGSFALESAMDELAYALDLDPLELRLRNYAEQNPQTNLPWSSKSLKECYQQAAERIGWTRRSSQPRSMRDGEMLVGLGMATATYPVYLRPATARVQILADGRARAMSGTQEIGTGTYTVMAQVAADTLGMSIQQVQFELGDTQLPMASASGGSSTAASVGSAVHLAAKEARCKVLAIATEDSASPLHGLDEQEILVENGCCYAKDNPSRRETYVSILKRHQIDCIEATSQLDSNSEQKYSMYAFGAHFAEVRVNPNSGEVQVIRFVSGFGNGRILNAKTARSQVMGGIIFGISMALLEQTVVDERIGSIVNPNLGEYLVPVNADIHTIETFFVEEEDTHVNPIGVKGAGEIGIVGSAAAVANAVYHATGKRVRDLPITLDKLL